MTDDQLLDYERALLHEQRARIAERAPLGRRPAPRRARRIAVATAASAAIVVVLAAWPTGHGTRQLAQPLLSSASADSVQRKVLATFAPSASVWVVEGRSYDDAGRCQVVRTTNRDPLGFWRQPCRPRAGETGFGVRTDPHDPNRLQQRTVSFGPEATYTASSSPRPRSIGFGTKRDSALTIFDVRRNLRSGRLHLDRTATLPDGRSALVASTRGAGPHDRRDRTRYWIDSRTFHVVRITWKGQTLATYDWQRATPERLRGLWPPLPSGAPRVR